MAWTRILLLAVIALMFLCCGGMVVMAWKRSGPPDEKDRK